MAVGGLKAAEELNPLQEQQSGTPDNKKIKKGSLTTLKGTKKEVKTARPYWTIGKVLTAGAGVFLAGAALSAAIPPAIYSSALAAGGAALTAAIALRNRTITDLRAELACYDCPTFDHSNYGKTGFNVTTVSSKEFNFTMADGNKPGNIKVSCYGSAPTSNPIRNHFEGSKCSGVINNREFGNRNITFKCKDEHGTHSFTKTSKELKDKMVYQDTKQCQAFKIKPITNIPVIWKK